MVEDQWLFNPYPDQPSAYSPMNVPKTHLLLDWRGSLIWTSSNLPFVDVGYRGSGVGQSAKAA
jgi:hypothetical protein